MSDNKKSSKAIKKSATRDNRKKVFLHETNSYKWNRDPNRRSRQNKSRDQLRVSFSLGERQLQGSSRLQIHWAKTVRSIKLRFHFNPRSHNEMENGGWKVQRFASYKNAREQNEFVAKKNSQKALESNKRSEKKVKIPNIKINWIMQRTAVANGARLSRKQSRQFESRAEKKFTSCWLNTEKASQFAWGEQHRCLTRSSA